MVDLARIRRPPGGGRLLFGLSHAQTWVLLVALVLVVALAIYLNRRR
jgi:hypothetical protein